MPYKIAVTGSVNGKLSEFFTKLNTLQAKQNFAFTIVTGDLFADPESTSESEASEIAQLINGSIEVSVTTYFAIGHRALPETVVKKLESSDGELCPNLIALGRKGRVKTSDGFQIVAIGGAQHAGDEPMDSYAALYSEKDVSTAKGYNDADILVSSDWPAAIRRGSREKFDAKEPPRSEALAELCSALKPRYHFSSSELFYEREPFFHQADPPRPITRFLSLASYGNAKKSKWIYAFSLEPSADPPQQVPEDTTASPFSAPKKRKLESQQDTFNNLRYANGNGQVDSYRPHGGKRRRAAGPPPAPSECYFCLSNRQFEAHMAGSINEAAYIATAKGPLPLNTTFPDLGFPCHVLIILIDHMPTLSAIPAAARQQTEIEMQKYRDALHQMIAAKSKDPTTGHAKLGAVTWEISRSGGVHHHWQFLPVPVDLITKDVLQDRFKAEAEASAYPTQFATTPADIATAEEGDFFKVMIWSEEMRMEMVLPLDQTFRFDLQFGRRVMGKLLGLEKRTHWKDCGQSRVEEEADCEKFKEAFKAFDPTL